MGLPLQKPTLSSFLEWESAQPERHEFYRGDIFAMVGGTARHHRVIVNLTRRLDVHLDGTGCRVFAETMKVRLADEAILYPDVMVACDQAESGDAQAVTDPALIIEVQSPSIKGYDQRDKFILYRSLPSLREYVLIDPATRRVEVFTAAGAGTWLLTDQTGFGALTLQAVELALPFDQVFKGVEAPGI